jgi:pyrroline-5-carboxylate reductase
MASAIIGGLLRQGWSTDRLVVVEPHEAARQQLLGGFGLIAQAVADDRLQTADMVVWAVKPQTFAQAAAAVRPWAQHALHLSVAAGIRVDSIATWLGTSRVIRTMPNTPALIGRGMTALFAANGLLNTDRAWAQQVLQASGALLWLDEESQLDAVTALSGSGPAYVFFFLEAMMAAGVQMGLSAEQAKQLALVTFDGATALAMTSEEAPALLRERVTSKGGTTFAALEHLQQRSVHTHFIEAMLRARDRASEMAAQFAADQR